jgi:hypothetical protein
VCLAAEAEIEKQVEKMARVRKRFVHTAKPNNAIDESGQFSKI